MADRIFPTQYNSVQAAINAALPGDRVLVRGDATGKLVIRNKSNIKILGQKPDGTTPANWTNDTLYPADCDYPKITGGTVVTNNDVTIEIVRSDDIEIGFLRIVAEQNGDGRAIGLGNFNANPGGGEYTQKRIFLHDLDIMASEYCGKGVQIWGAPGHAGSPRCGTDYLTVDRVDVHGLPGQKLGRRFTSGPSGFGWFSQYSDDTTAGWKNKISRLRVWDVAQQYGGGAVGPAITDGNGVIADVGENTSPGYVGGILFENCVFWGNGAAGFSDTRSSPSGGTKFGLVNCSLGRNNRQHHELPPLDGGPLVIGKGNIAISNSGGAQTVAAYNCFFLGDGPSVNPEMVWTFQGLKVQVRHARYANQSVGGAYDDQGNNAEVPATAIISNTTDLDTANVLPSTGSPLLTGGSSAAWRPVNWDSSYTITPPTTDYWGRNFSSSGGHGVGAFTSTSSTPNPNPTPSFEISGPVVATIGSPSSWTKTVAAVAGDTWEVRNAQGAVIANATGASITWTPPAAGAYTVRLTSGLTIRNRTVLVDGGCTTTGTGGITVVGTSTGTGPRPAHLTPGPPDFSPTDGWIAPPGIQAGDTIIVMSIDYSDLHGLTLTPPAGSGWTRVINLWVPAAQNVVDSAYRPRMTAWWKTANGTESGEWLIPRGNMSFFTPHANPPPYQDYIPYDIDGEGTHIPVGGIVVLRGANPSGMVTGATHANLGAQLAVWAPAPGLSAPANNSIAIWFYGCNNGIGWDDGPTYSGRPAVQTGLALADPPAGWTKIPGTPARSTFIGSAGEAGLRYGMQLIDATICYRTLATAGEPVPSTPTATVPRAHMNVGSGTLVIPPLSGGGTGGAVPSCSLSVSDPAPNVGSLVTVSDATNPDGRTVVNRVWTVLAPNGTQTTQEGVALGFTPTMAGVHTVTALIAYSDGCNLVCSTAFNASGSTAPPPPLECGDEPVIIGVTQVNSGGAWNVPVGVQAGDLILVLVQGWASGSGGGALQAPPGFQPVSGGVHAPPTTEPRLSAFYRISLGSETSATPTVASPTNPNDVPIGFVVVVRCFDPDQIFNLAVNSGGVNQDVITRPAGSTTVNKSLVLWFAGTQSSADVGTTVGGWTTRGTASGGSTHRTSLRSYVQDTAGAVQTGSIDL